MQRRSSLSFLFLGVLSVCILCPLASARCDDAAEKLVLATYKLASEGSTATCMVVRNKGEDGAAKSFVVTAHHVLVKTKGDTCILVSRTRRNEGTYQRREIRIPVRKAGQPLWTKHATHDLAALPLPHDIEVVSLPLDSLATEQQLVEVRVGDGVRLAVFPERDEANKAGFPILRTGAIASYPVVPVQQHPMFLVDTNAWTGDSGGPVMHATLRSPSGGPLVIGVVRGMRSITDTVKESRFVERKTRYPLGISEVLHATLVRGLVAPDVAEK